MRTITAKDELLGALKEFKEDYYVVNKINELQISLAPIIGFKRAIDILAGKEVLENLSETELYILLIAFKDFYNENENNLKYSSGKLKASLYFTEEEITRMNIRLQGIETEEIEEKEEELFVLEGVYQVTEKQWMLPRIDAQTLVGLIYNNFVMYDFDIQREAKISIVDGQEMKKINVNKKSVEEMAFLMSEGKYKPTPLTINILDILGDEVHFHYDDEAHTLTLSRSDRNALIDGMHRLYAILINYNKNPQFNQVMQLNIFNMNITEARAYVHQQAQQNAISKEVLDKYNTNNVYNLLATEIEKAGSKEENLLQGRLADTKEDVLRGKFTTYSKFAESLEDAYTINVNNTRERRILRTHVINFYNELFSILNDDINNIKESREESIALHPCSVYMYTYMSQRLLIHQDWENKLDYFMSQLDFSTTSELATYIRPTKYDLTVRGKKQLYRYLDNELAKLISN